MSSKQPDNNAELVIIATVSGLLQAQMLRALLDSVNIQSFLDYESAGVLFGLTVNGLKLSQVRIWVDARDADFAQKILNAEPSSQWEQEADSPLES